MKRELESEIGEHFTNAWNKTSEGIDSGFSVLVLGAAWLLVSCGIALQKFNQHWRDKQDSRESYPRPFVLDKSVR